jgi:hypothetical protein
MRRVKRPAERLAIVSGIALSAIILVLAFLPPWPQNPAYHRFADARPFAGIPNALNVLSNVAFLIPGIALLRGAASPGGVARRLRAGATSAIAVYAFGTIATALGSAYYHLKPNDHTLVHDRVGITIALAGFVALVAEDRIGAYVRPILYACLVVGIASIAVWIAAGDLRLYGAFQGLSLVLCAFMAAAFEPRTVRPKLWIVLAGYVVAKAAETFDKQIYAATSSIVSGHTLKHLAAGAAIYVSVLWLRERGAVSAEATTT